MAAYNKFNSWVERMTEDANIGSDVFKMMLTNAAPLATNSVTADITQIAGVNGYTTGGLTITTTSALHTTGVQKLILADCVLTAAAGAVGPFRYAVVVDSTLASGALVAWYDYGSSITLADSETFTLDFDGAAGFFTVT